MDLLDSWVLQPLLCLSCHFLNSKLSFWFSLFRVFRGNKFSNKSSSNFTIFHVFWLQTKLYVMCETLEVKWNIVLSLLNNTFCWLSPFNSGWKSISLILKNTPKKVKYVLYAVPFIHVNEYFHKFLINYWSMQCNVKMVVKSV